VHGNKLMHARALRTRVMRHGAPGHSRNGIYRCGPERRNSRSARNTLL
jgi:hypothetical protein